MAWWVCWDVSNSGFTVVVMFYTQRDLAGCFFFSPYMFLCQRLRERDEKEKREKEIVKK